MGCDDVSQSVYLFDLTRVPIDPIDFLAHVLAGIGLTMLSTQVPQQLHIKIQRLLIPPFIIDMKARFQGGLDKMRYRRIWR